MLWVTCLVEVFWVNETEQNHMHQTRTGCPLGTKKHRIKFRMMWQTFEIPDSMDPTTPKNINSYMECYFWDHNLQLERRLAVGDRTFINKLPKRQRKILHQIIKDCQNQILTVNDFVRMIKSMKKQVKQNPEFLFKQGSEECKKYRQDLKRNERDPVTLSFLVCDTLIVLRKTLTFHRTKKVL